MPPQWTCWEVEPGEAVRTPGQRCMPLPGPSSQRVAVGPQCSGPPP